MRVLLDEDVTRLICAELEGHECQHMEDLGWKGSKNGRLLTLAEENGFDVLVTQDKGLPYQNNLALTKMSIVVLSQHGRGPQNTLALAPKLVETLKDLAPGTWIRITNRPGSG